MMSSLCLTPKPLPLPGFDDLFYWADKHRAQVKDVYVAENTQGINGVFAGKDFEPGERIIHMPKACILTCDLARISAIGQAISESNSDNESEHNYLAMFMLADRASHISRWHYYYQSLPQDFSEHPLFYPQDQLIHLAGSSALELIHRRRYLLQQSYQVMTDALADNFQFSHADYQVARTLINTRCFAITLEGREQIAMIPVVDMINHGDDDRTFRGNDGDGYSVWAKDTIAKGEEITLSYGNKSQQRYFANYGFLRHSSLDNECKVIIQLKGDGPSLQEKMVYLNITTPAIELTLGQDITLGIEQAMPILTVAASTSLLQNGNHQRVKQHAADNNPALLLLKTALLNKLACYNLENKPRNRFSPKVNPLITALLQSEQQLLKQYLYACTHR